MLQFSEADIGFSQYAQVPYEEFNEMLQREDESSNRVTKDKKSKQQRRQEKSKKQNSNKSFVMSKLQQRGVKLIKISVIDLCKNNSQDSDSDSDTENVILCAQYVVTNVFDSVMDETECLVKKISKSLTDDCGCDF